MQLLGHLLVSGLVRTLVKLYDIVLGPMLERWWELPLASQVGGETGFHLLFLWATQCVISSGLRKEQMFEPSWVAW